MEQVFWGLSFKGIERVLAERVAALGDKLDHVEITWFEIENFYILLLGFCPAKGYYPMPKDRLPWGDVEVASIGKWKGLDLCPENLDVLRKAGRDLYYRLWKKYPVKRNLGR